MGKIQLDSEGNITNWYGFITTQKANKKRCFIAFFRDEEMDIEPGKIEVHVDGKIVETINWESKFGIKGFGHTQSEIWDYIYKECRKYCGKRKIFVDSEDIELGFGNCGGDWEDIEMFLAKEEENDFFEQREKERENWF